MSLSVRAVRSALLVILVGVLSACASGPTQPPAAIETRPLPARQIGPAVPLAAPESEEQRTRRLLYAQFENWKGTRHVLGGTTRKGIDCSGYVLDTYKRQFGIELPRTTSAMATRGRPVERTALRAGDLVFFRIGRSGKHVGIYLEDGRFMHTSRQVGVTISKLKSRYWRSHYWQARRLDDSG